MIPWFCYWNSFLYSMISSWENLAHFEATYDNHNSVYFVPSGTYYFSAAVFVVCV